MSDTKSVDILFFIEFNVRFTSQIVGVLINKPKIQTILSPVNIDLLVKFVARTFDIVSASCVIEGVFKSIVVEEQRVLVPYLSFNKINWSHEIVGQRLSDVFQLSGGQYCVKLHT